jgi:hypothetical protein
MTPYQVSSCFKKIGSHGKAKKVAIFSHLNGRRTDSLQHLPHRFLLLQTSQKLHHRGSSKRHRNLHGKALKPIKNRFQGLALLILLIDSSIPTIHYR